MDPGTSTSIKMASTPFYRMRRLRDSERMMEGVSDVACYWLLTDFISCLPTEN